MNKSLFILFLFLGTALPVFSASSGSDKSPKNILEGVYGWAIVNPSDLNSARQNFIWNGTSAASGSFSKLTYFGGSFGRRLFSHLSLSVRYEQNSQALAKTDVGSSMTVVDYFVYNPIFLLLEIPFQLKRLTFSLGGGAGYAMNYEYHQQYSGTREDITYKANPTVLRGRVTMGFAFSKHFGVFAEACYDKVTATSLAADKAYQATVNGTAISAGQTFKDSTGNAAAQADMSGIRYGVGLRLGF